MQRLALTVLLVSVGVSACDGGADVVAVVKPLGSFTVGARDTVAVDLAAHVAGGASTTFALDRPVAGIWIDGSRLMLAPKYGQRYALNVIVSSGPGKSTRLPFVVNEPPTWTVRPPSGTLDPLPFLAGDTVRFAFKEWTNPESTYSSQVVREGTVTWAVLAQRATPSGLELDINETVALVDGTHSQARQTVLLPETGSLPGIGSVVVPRGSAFVPRFLSIKPDGTAGSSDLISAGFGHACYLNTHATTDGLQTYWVNCAGGRPWQSRPNSLRLDRLR